MRPFLSLLMAEMLISGLLLHPGPAQAQTTGPITPIQHLVVIFQENISFDHYFGTYPNALNRRGAGILRLAPNAQRQRLERRADEQQPQYE